MGCSLCSLSKGCYGRDPNVWEQIDDGGQWSNQLSHNRDSMNPVPNFIFFQCCVSLDDPD